MQTLESFYFDYLSSNLSHEDRNHGIMIFGDIICINFDAVYGHLRECTLRGVDQLLYLVHKNGKGKRFIFLSEDGAIIKHSGAFQFIINCVECFNLNEDTCAVFCRENLCIPNVRVFNMNFVHYWVNGIWNTVKSAPLQQGNLEKKFAVWFNRGTFFRLQLMRHLFENYKIDKCKALKIDCEGSELDIFESITTENLNKIKKMVIETHSDYIDTFIKNKLFENNFEVKTKKDVVRGESENILFVEKIIK